MRNPSPGRFYFYDKNGFEYITTISHGGEYFQTFNFLNDHLYFINFYPYKYSTKIPAEWFSVYKGVELNLIDQITYFFSFQPYGILAYVCDYEDNRHYARQRLFGKWYDNANNQWLTRISGEIEDICFAFLFKNISPWKETVKNAIYQEIEYLEMLKDES